MADHAEQIGPMSPHLPFWEWLLRVPRTAMGAPWLWGMLAALLMGTAPSANEPATDIGIATPVVTELSRELFSLPLSGWQQFGAALVGGLGHVAWSVKGIALLKLVGWLLLGYAITEHAARTLADREPISLVRAATGALKNALVLMTTLLLLGLIVGLPMLLLLAAGWLGESELGGSLVSSLWGVVLIAVALPATLLGLGALVGGAMVLPARVVDRADPFDAISRLYAYTFQQPLALLVALAGLAVVGLLVAFAVELLVVLTIALAHALVGDMPAVHGAAGWWEGAFRTLAAGIYPAYFFTAVTALYLLRRQQVDDQPADDVTL